MANIQSKKVIESNTYSRYRKTKSNIKKTVKLVKNKLGHNIEEKDNSFIQKIMLEITTELPIKTLILNNFAKNLQEQFRIKLIQLIKNEIKFIKRYLSRL